MIQLQGADVAVGEMPILPPDALQGHVLTFRKLKSASQRLRVETSNRLEIAAPIVTLVGVVEDAAAGLEIVWEVVATAAPGTIIRLIDRSDIGFLSRAIYCEMVEVLSDTQAKGWRIVECRRRERPASELQDGWTFGLPVGGRDATALNMAVERILSYRVPKEIILCGEPPEDFLYRDVVRILPDPRPGILALSAKKNLIAREARYSRLCVLHDRVLLPRDFEAAVGVSDDLFPVLTFATYYFLDHDGLRGRRYSDLNTEQRFENMPIRTISDAPTPPAFNVDMAQELGRTATYAYVPRRGFDSCDYATGSLYIMPTWLWRAIGQDEELIWELFEDVEFARRCRWLGVPHRILDGASALSIVGRSAVIDAVGTFFARGGWTSTTYHPLPFMSKAPRRKRCLVGRSYSDYRRDVYVFVERWCRPSPDVQLDACIAALDGPGRQRSLLTLLHQVDRDAVKTETALRALVVDFERLVLLETLEVGGKHESIKRLAHFGASLPHEILDNWTVKAQCRLVSSGVFDFLGENRDRFIRPLDSHTRRGLFWFCVHAHIFSRDELCPKGGGWALYRQLKDTWLRDEEYERAAI